MEKVFMQNVLTTLNNMDVKLDSEIKEQSEFRGRTDEHLRILNHRTAKLEQRVDCIEKETALAAWMQENPRLALFMLASALGITGVVAYGVI